ncbi:hypothetical protein PR202_ga14975 [Eleusine coracana subsp. coracana]|uniref:Uncharacterized protein n=1 Tax=Eleusine coracana subsp. coracana TaxID=191504 RepID=A0AAV5CHU4_ELECO|nr:hypothetical protein PR202_ga14975 [Eleusine coracana subsp. coracana]
MSAKARSRPRPCHAPTALDAITFLLRPVNDSASCFFPPPPPRTHCTATTAVPGPVDVGEIVRVRYTRPSESADSFRSRGGDSVGSDSRPAAMSGVFGKVFGKSKVQSQATALASLDKLNETLEMLEKKENLLIKKANLEVEKAKNFTKAKNKRDDNAGSCKSYNRDCGCIENWSISNESYAQINDELEAELADLEGEELEAELLAPTTTAPTTAPVRVPTAPQSTRPSAQSSKTEDDELAALQAEMAM